MTIKKRIFISNIRVVLVTLIGLWLAVMAFRLILFLYLGTWTIDYSKMAELEKHRPEGWLGGIKGFVFFALFVTIISAINNLFTSRLINTIVRPLNPLNEGVRQIHDGNLGYRINYQDDDEFRPICEAFNEMAARLETSDGRRQKDEANRRELIAGLSHDLRTPLTSIKGYLEGLEAGVAATPVMRKEYFTTIKNKTSDLEHIIEQLFQFSKLDMGEFPLTLRRVAAAPVIQDMIEEIAGEYAMRGLDIHLAEIPQDTTVFADTLYLRNVIINILENSVTYKTEARGRMEINAAPNNGTVTLRFADNGPGVAAKTLDKLFDAHYREDPSRNKKGSGLGLAISAKIIERMGGSCRAELPASGGLAVVITLPATEQGTTT